METLQLKVGESYTIELEGLGTAGYIWVYNVSGAVGSVEVESRSGSSPPPVGVHTPSSYSAPIIFTVHALKPGYVTLSFKLVRPWRKERAVRVRTLELDVIDK